MYPISYILVQGTAAFKYNLSELKEWLALGNTEGNVGPLLLSINYVTGFQTFASYGTIEHPNRKRHTFHMKHLAIFGPLPDPERVMTPPKESPYKNFGIFIPDGKGGAKKWEL